MKRLTTPALAMALAACIAAPALGGTRGEDAQASGSPKSSRLPMSCTPSYRRPHFHHYPALHRALAPPGVENLTICRYAGDNPRDPHSLVGARTLFDGTRIHRLVGLLDQLPKHPTSAIACPAEEGRDVVIHLRYRTRPETPIKQELDGCTYTTNGPRTRWAARPPGPKLIELLRRLVPTGD